jgi:hypothetical protein
MVGALLVLPLGTAAAVGRVVLMEGQAGGQLVRNFTLEGRPGAGAAWAPLAAGQSIGHKRIVVLNATVVLTAVRLTVLAAEGGPPMLRSLAAYGAAPCALPPPPPHAPCELQKGYAFEGNGAPPPPVPHASAPRQRPTRHRPAIHGPGLTRACGAAVLRTLPGTGVSACCTACRAVPAKACVAFKVPPGLTPTAPAAGLMDDPAVAGHRWRAGRARSSRRWAAASSSPAPPAAPRSGGEASIAIQRMLYPAAILCDVVGEFVDFAMAQLCVHFIELIVLQGCVSTIRRF